MKGFSVQNGVELRIEIIGEAWSQGEPVRVRLEAKKESTLFLELADGSEKKIRAKATDAFKTLSRIQGTGTLLETTFELPLDCRISDKSGSLHVLYGVGNPPAQPASLRLTVNPNPHLKDLGEVLTHHYRFTLKSVSMGKKSDVEMKFEPSGGKEWASLESLTVSARLLKTELQLKFFFQRKEINALKSALTAQSVKRTIEKNFPLKDILHDFNQRLNKENVTAGLDSIFEEYRARGGIFS